MKNTLQNYGYLLNPPNFLMKKLIILTLFYTIKLSLSII